jgi:hypothetical protein
VFASRHSHGDVDVAFTDRRGGVSGGEFSSLDLGSTAQDEVAFAENLRRVTQAFTCASPPERAAPVVLLRQVHGADVAVVEDPDGPIPQADAVVTGLPGVVLMVRVADCVPVLLADAEAGLVAAVHAGRQGLVAGVVPAAIACLEGLGAGRLVAWVGPRVCGGCYEVPEAMCEEVSAVVPEARARTSWGTAAVDVAAGVHAQLTAVGVRADDVTDVRRCTMEDTDLFSYRRQGRASGRGAGLIWRRP